MKKIIYLLMFLFMVGMVNASSYIFEKDKPIDLKIACVDEIEMPCNATIECNMTILYPNGTILLNNQPMTHNPSYYNYSLNETYNSKIGKYYATIFCLGVGNGFSAFGYEINPTGKEMIEGQGFTSIGLIMAVILLSFLFAWFGFKFSESNSLFFVSLFFMLASLITGIFGLQLGYIFTRDILYNLTIDTLQFKLWLGLTWGLLGMAFIVLIFFIIKVIKEFLNKAKTKRESDGYNREY